MIAANLLDGLRQKGVELWFEGTRLRYRAPPGSLLPEERASLGEHREVVITLLRADAAKRSEGGPLSLSQQSLWFLYQQAPESTAYNIALSIRIHSPVDIGALRHAVQALVDRHGSLRTRFGSSDGIPVQEIAGDAAAVFQEHDLAGISDADLRARVESDFLQPFDLEQGAVMRCSLYSASADDHVFLLAVHHIVADGWSLMLLFEELLKLYGEGIGGPAAGLPRLKIGYADHVRSQQEMLAGAEGERLLGYWRRKLAALPAGLDLPTDRPRPAVQRFQGASVPVAFDARQVAVLKAFAREQRATLFVVLLASFHALLHRLTGAEDLIVGTPTFARGKLELDRVVGDFVNSVPLRATLSSGTTSRELVAQVRLTVMEALEAQEFPLPLMVQKLMPQRDASRGPLFETFFSLQRFDHFAELQALPVGRDSGVPLDVAGLRLTAFPLRQQEGQFDLTLQMWEQGDALHGSLKYNVDLFEESTVARWAGLYRTLLEGLTTKPDEPIGILPLLDPLELKRMVRDLNATDVVSRFASGSVFSREFEARAALQPDRPAVVFDGSALSYGELNARANRLARHLKQLGVGAGVLVAVCVSRGLDLAVALLGVLKSGGAYVPLDPDFPAERLSYMLVDSGARVLIVTEDTAGDVQVPEGMNVLHLQAESDKLGSLSGENLPEAPAPQDPVYVIYTSGSTGLPKGVVVPHGALLNFLESMEQAPGLAAKDVLAAVTTISFDIAGLELYLSWLVGARVEMIPRTTAVDGEALGASLAACGATVLQATPATWRLLLDAGWRAPPGFKALCGGEALPRTLADSLLETVDVLWNLYGPTETTIWSTAERVEPGPDAIAIGRPIANTQVYVLDKSGQPTPLGIPGELWIGGAGVALGYHRRPELTAERFVPDRFAATAGARMYATGDLARWRTDGRLEHLGRLDNQVKIRGFRIEPGEVEAVLAAHPAVREAVVVAAKAGADDRRLVAYVVYRQRMNPTVSEMRRHVRRMLPDYMVPSVIVGLDSMPLTPNGKVQRSALPNPFQGAAQASEAFEPPMAGMEQMIARIWQEILEIERVGANDNFFELGGHSLLSLRVVVAIQKMTGKRIDPRMLFFQSLRQTAAVVEGSLPSLVGAAAS